MMGDTTREKVLKLRRAREASMALSRSCFEQEAVSSSEEGSSALNNRVLQGLDPEKDCLGRERPGTLTEQIRERELQIRLQQQLKKVTPEQYAAAKRALEGKLRGNGTFEDFRKNLETEYNGEIRAFEEELYTELEFEKREREINMIYLRKHAKARESIGKRTKTMYSQGKTGVLQRLRTAKTEVARLKAEMNVKTNSFNLKRARELKTVREQERLIQKKHREMPQRTPPPQQRTEMVCYVPTPERAMTPQQPTTRAQSPFHRTLLGPYNSQEAVLALFQSNLEAANQARGVAESPSVTENSVSAVEACAVLYERLLSRKFGLIEPRKVVF